jgi:hypothetical protein
VEPGVDDTPLGVVSAGGDPQPGDSVGSPCHDLVVHGVGTSTLGLTTLSGAVLALESSGAVGPRIAGLLLLGSPRPLSPPINWGHVEDSAEQACSQVVTVGRLLWKMLAAVDRDILHPIWVSLKERGKFT